MKNKFKKFCIGLSLPALLGGCATMTPVKTTSKAGLEKELTETEKELMDIRKNGIKGKDKSFYGMEREDTIFYELDKIAEDELKKYDRPAYERRGTLPLMKLTDDDDDSDIEEMETEMAASDAQPQKKSNGKISFLKRIMD